VNRSIHRQVLFRNLYDLEWTGIISIGPVRCPQSVSSTDGRKNPACRGRRDSQLAWVRLTRLWGGTADPGLPHLKALNRRARGVPSLVRAPPPRGRVPVRVVGAGGGRRYTETQDGRTEANVVLQVARPLAVGRPVTRAKRNRKASWTAPDNLTVGTNLGASLAGPVNPQVVGSIPTRGANAQLARCELAGFVVTPKR
jgi:hypothetical protein